MSLDQKVNEKVYTLAIDYCWFTYRVKLIHFCFTPGVTAIYAVQRALNQTEASNLQLLQLLGFSEAESRMKLETQINQIQELALTQENLEKSPEYFTVVKKVKDVIHKMKRDYGDFWESIKREIKQAKVEPEGFWEDAQSVP